MFGLYILQNTNRSRPRKGSLCKSCKIQILLIHYCLFNDLFFHCSKQYINGPINSRLLNMNCFSIGKKYFSVFLSFF